MENKGFWIGGIVLALIVGIVMGIIWQRNKSQKSQKQTKTTSTTAGKEIPLKPAVEPQKPSETPTEPIKTA